MTYFNPLVAPIAQGTQTQRTAAADKDGSHSRKEEAAGCLRRIVGQGRRRREMTELTGDNPVVGLNYGK